MTIDNVSLRIRDIKWLEHDDSALKLTIRFYDNTELPIIVGSKKVFDTSKKLIQAHLNKEEK